MNEVQYTELVKNLFECVSVLFPADRNPFLFFAEGEGDAVCSGHQEFSVLRGEKAKFFVDTIERYVSVLNVNRGDFAVQDSPATLSGEKYYHSCYPKNIRRWMKGTVSRKKKCRVEFITLIYCHATEWGAEPAEKKYVDCQERLMEICQKVLDSERDMNELFPVLWSALEKVYRDG